METQTLVASARQAASEGRIDEALEAYRKVKDVSPRNRALIEFTALLIRENKNDEAIVNSIDIVHSIQKSSNEAWSNATARFRDNKEQFFADIKDAMLSAPKEKESSENEQLWSGEAIEKQVQICLAISDSFYNPSLGFLCAYFYDYALQDLTEVYFDHKITESQKKKIALEHDPDTDNEEYEESLSELESDLKWEFLDFIRGQADSVFGYTEAFFQSHISLIRCFADNGNISDLITDLKSKAIKNSDYHYLLAKIHLRMEQTELVINALASVKADSPFYTYCVVEKMKLLNGKLDTIVILRDIPELAVVAEKYPKSREANLELLDILQRLTGVTCNVLRGLGVDTNAMSLNANDSKAGGEDLSDTLHNREHSNDGSYIDSPGHEENSRYMAQLIANSNQSLSKKIEGLHKEIANLSPFVRSTKKLSHTTNIKSFIEEGETQSIEFKQSLRWSYRKKANDENIIFSCLKAVVGLVNSNDGIVLLGIDDDGGITGISVDGFDSDDKYSLFLMDKMRDKVNRLLPSYINIMFELVQQQKVCIIECQKAPKPIYLSGELYVRQNASTVKLSTEDANVYVKEAFGD
jgi:hypothetical protein